MDTLPAPFVDGVGRVYLQLKEIFGIVTVRQAESSL
jgi:hypothetical protein